MKVNGDLRKITVGQSDLSRAMNLSRQRITQLLQEKILRRDETDPSGGVFLFDSLKSYYTKNSSGSDEDYWRVKTEHEAEKCKVTALKRQELEGSLISAELVEAELAEMLTVLRNNLLGLPAKFAAQLEGKSRAEIYDLMTQDIEEKLQELSDNAKCVMRNE